MVPGHILQRCSTLFSSLSLRGVSSCRVHHSELVPPCGVRVVVVFLCCCCLCWLMFARRTLSVLGMVVVAVIVLLCVSTADHGNALLEAYLFSII